MKKHIKELGKHISNHRYAWLMGVVNIIATGIIANGGFDIANNKTRIENGEDNIAALHKRITAIETRDAVQDAAQDAQIKWIKEEMDNLSRRIDELMKK